MDNVTLEEAVSEIRGNLKIIERGLRKLMNHPRYDEEQLYSNQHSEMKAQTMLAIRHIEDARMRCGKILQYADDGVSIFDK
jgi:hypothetical protein